MNNSKTSGLAGWLERKSIDQRLTVQVVLAIVASASLLATIAVGSLVSLHMINRNNQVAQEALYGALLENDFASLERDVFRHSLLRNAKTEDAYKGNVSDLWDSISEIKPKLDAANLTKLDTISGNAKVYVSTVEGKLAAGPINEPAANEMSAAGRKVDKSIEAIRKPSVKATLAMVAEQRTTSQTIMVVSIALALMTGLVTLLIGRIVKRSISNEIGSLSDAIGRIASGDLDVEIAYTERADQLGALARAAVQLRETSRAKRQSDTELEMMATTVGDNLRKMAQGDLTVELPELGASYAGLRSNFNSAIAQLHETVSSVSNAAQDIRSGAKEINQASSDLAQRTEQHAAELAHAAESVGVITRSLQETAGIARQANQGVDDAVNEARHGGEVVGKAVKAMSNIENSSAEIGQIINVIDGIAFQTNLLALNAGVEAARAGDAGKGFAVVANEVRALAQRSADAAKDIKALITTSGAEVEEGARMVRQAGEALEQITARINGISDMVTHITGAASDQSAKLAEINTAMGKMDHVTQQNAAMVEESTAAARSLLQEADGLTDRVGGFICRPSAESGARAAPVRKQVKRPAAPAISGNLALAIPAPSAEDWAEF